MEDESISSSATADGADEELDASGVPTIAQEVIQKAHDECMALHANMTHPATGEGTYCPRVFDGWSCWNDTPAGTIAFVHCPKFIPGFDPKRKGFRVCTENGTWFRHPDTNDHWSNYTGCVDISSLESFLTVNRIYIGGYSISLAGLMLSLFIFCFFRSLKCKRVTIHKNLFLSFIINNFLWLIWHLFVIETPQVVSANGIGCQILHILLNYFLVCNYMWMFCEGLYLHTLLVFAFVSEDKILKYFYLLGWGCPIAFTIIYASIRGSDPNASTYCWIYETNYDYIMTGPVCLSLVLNLFFLVNIVRVLLTKLRAANTTTDNQATKKAVRATLILIPLLGLHYVLLPFRPDPETYGHHIYNIISAVAASFQGLAVSLLFCFFNGEVLAIFKKKWNQHKLMRSPHSYAATSVSYMKSSLADGVTFTTNCSETLLDVQDV